MLITVKELAKELSMHPESVRRLVRVGKIPCTVVMVGKKHNFRFDLDLVMAKLEATSYRYFKKQLAKQK